MKKTLRMLVYLVVTLSLTAMGLAEGAPLDAQLTDVIDANAAGEAVEGAADVIDGYEIMDAKTGMTRAGRYDSVVIDGSEYSVITAENIEILYRQSKGNNAYCLTQDYVAQHELYEQFYSSPIATVQHFIETGMHFNIYDEESGVDIFLYIGEAAWAAAYPNVSRLDAEEALELLEAMNQSWETFQSAADTQVGWLGGNVYFYANARRSGTVHLLTTVNGYEVYVRYEAKTGAEVNRGLALLEDLTIRAR